MWNIREPERLSLATASIWMRTRWRAANLSLLLALWVPAASRVRLTNVVSATPKPMFHWPLMLKSMADAAVAVAVTAATAAIKEGIHFMVLSLWV